MQVLSHQLAVAGWENHLPKPSATCATIGQLLAGWQDHLSKPRAIWAVVGEQGCCPVRLNVLQRQPVLILSGRVRREGAEDDDSDSNQHCRNETYGEEAVDVFHKRSFQALWKTVNDEDKKPLLSHVGSVAVKLMQLDRTQRQRVTHVNACAA